MAFISADGDGIGAVVGRLRLENDIQNLKTLGSKIDQGNQVFAKWAETRRGEVIESGGDEIALRVPDEHIQELEDVCKQYKEVTGTTVSVGVGDTLAESSKALFCAKLNGKDQIAIYDAACEDLYGHAMTVEAKKTEREKLQEEYAGHLPLLDILEGRHTPKQREEEQQHPDFLNEFQLRAEKESAERKRKQQLAEVKKKLAQALVLLKEQAPVLGELKEQAPELYDAINRLAQTTIGLAKEIKQDEQLHKSVETLEKWQTPLTFPKLGMEDRRETPLITTPRQQEIKNKQIAWALKDLGVPSDPSHEVAHHMAYDPGLQGAVIAHPDVNVSYAKDNPLVTVTQQSNTSGQATQHHENLHQVFKRIRDKHGEQAASNLIDNLFFSLPPDSAKALAALTAPYHGMKLSPTKLREEALAGVFNFVNDPASRKSFHKKFKLGPLQQKEFEGHVKSALKHLRQRATEADHTWLSDYIHKSMETLEKWQTPITFPKMGLEDRKETPLIEEVSQVPFKVAQIKRDINTMARFAMKYGVPSAWPSGLPMTSDKKKLKEAMEDMASDNFKQGHGYVSNLSYPGTSGAKGEALREMYKPSISTGERDPDGRVRNKKGQNRAILVWPTGSKSPQATLHHENMHQIFSRVQGKHGPQARGLLAVNLMNSLPASVYNKAAPFFTFKNGHLPFNSLRAEEDIAAMHNYLNDPAAREVFHRKSGHTDYEKRVIGNAIKRAHKHLRNVAANADHTWVTEFKKSEPEMKKRKDRAPSLKKSKLPIAKSPPKKKKVILPVGTEVSGKIKVRHEDGSVGWVQVRSGRVMSEDGHPISSRNQKGK